MKRMFLIAGIALFFSCKQESTVVQEPQLEKLPELIYETEHCRYYCLQENGFGTCKVVTCECDQGYSCDASTSW